MPYKDHPRVRGDKVIWLAVWVMALGSPPRARG